MYRIIKGEIAIPIDTADLQPGYPSVITKLVPPPPRCDAHLGETSIHQIQIAISIVHSKLDYCNFP